MNWQAAVGAGGGGGGGGGVAGGGPTAPGAGCNTGSGWVLSWREGGAEERVAGAGCSGGGPLSKLLAATTSWNVGRCLETVSHDDDFFSLRTLYYICCYIMFGIWKLTGSDVKVFVTISRFE